MKEEDGACCYQCWNVHPHQLSDSNVYKFVVYDMLAKLDRFIFRELSLSKDDYGIIGDY